MYIQISSVRESVVAVSVSGRQIWSYFFVVRQFVTKAESINVTMNYGSRVLRWWKSNNWCQMKHI